MTDDRDDLLSIAGWIYAARVTGTAIKPDTGLARQCVNEARELIAEAGRKVAGESRAAKAVYTASKTKHADKWRQLRADGVNVIATWIDEAGPGETACFADLWVRCVREPSQADCLLVYCDEGDQLKGGLVEVGAALASGKPVYAVGPMSGSWTSHPLVTACRSLDEAVAKITGDDLADDLSDGARDYLRLLVDLGSLSGKSAAFSRERRELVNKGLASFDADLSIVPTDRGRVLVGEPEKMVTQPAGGVSLADLEESE